MIQKDYILRLIEEAAKVLAVAFRLKNDADFDAAKKIIDDAYSKLLKVDKSDVLYVANDELIFVLTDNLQFDLKKIEILANFFAEDASLENNVLIKRNLIEKSLLMIEYISKQDKIFSFERIAKLEKLKQMLETL